MVINSKILSTWSGDEAFASGEQTASMRRSLVAPAQLIHRSAADGARAWFQAHVLLQPFSSGIADRPRNPVIDLLDLVGDSVVHNEFHVTPMESRRTKSRERRFVSARHPTFVLNAVSRNELLTRRFPIEKSPGAVAGH